MKIHYNLFIFLFITQIQTVQQIQPRRLLMKNIFSGLSQKLNLFGKNNESTQENHEEQTQSNPLQMMKNKFKNIVGQYYSNPEQEKIDQEQQIKNESIKKIQDQLVEQYLVILDDKSVMWIEKFSKSKLNNQVYNLIKESSEILIGETLDFETILIFDNLIYHIHKFIDSSKTIKRTTDTEYQYYYLFSKNYRDNLQKYLQQIHSDIEIKCQTIDSEMCDEFFKGQLLQVSTNLNYYQDYSNPSSNIEQVEEFLYSEPRKKTISIQVSMSNQELQDNKLTSEEENSQDRRQNEYQSLDESIEKVDQLLNEEQNYQRIKITIVEMVGCIDCFENDYIKLEQLNQFNNIF